LWRLIRVVGDGVGGWLMGGESVVMRIVGERPWVLYVLLALLDMGGGEFSARDVAEALGLRSYVVQRALWWLRKYGFVEEVPGSRPRRYRLRSVDDPRLGDLRGARWVCGNTTVVRVGGLYVALINRVDSVVARVVREDVVECVRRLYTSSSSLDASAVARECGCSVREAVAAMRIVSALMCRA